MSRASVFSSPLLLGFEHVEHLLDRAQKSADHFPPHNIERLPASPSTPERTQERTPELWRIILAVAGFSPANLEVNIAARELTIRGSRQDEDGRHYLHQGIAGRSFSKSFVLADGMEVESAELKNGLLILTLSRRPTESKVLRIDVKD